MSKGTISQEQKTRRATGAQAFEEGLTTRDLPHIQSSPAAEDWLHGWWGAFYKQQQEDTDLITEWLDHNVPTIYTEAHCKIVAEILVRTPEYDRTSGIRCKLGNLSFMVPAPALLKASQS